MSAPLKGFAHYLSTPRVCVKVRRIKNSYTFELCAEEGVFLLPAGTRLIYPEKPIHVVYEGKEVQPAGRFVITAETIDPWHIVTDMF